MRRLNLGFYAGLILALGIVNGAGPATAAATKLKTYGEFNAKAAKKAQTDVRNAMTRKMDDLLSRAAEISPEYLLDYGLALELGREPATRKMTALQRQKLVDTFGELLNLYIRKKDNIALKGTEPELLEQPDFWIVLARGLAFVDPSPSIVTTDSQTGVVSTADVNTRTGAERKRYTLTGERPILDPQITSAGQTCAIYAKVSARMQKVIRVEHAADPKVTPQQLAGFKAQARDILKQARSLGIDACAGREFYEEVTTFAGQNLGKLGTLSDDASAPSEPEAPAAP